MSERTPDRGLSTPLSHVLSVGITTILIVGLMTGASGFLENQSEQTVRQELDTIGNRIAGELDQADTLGRQGDNVTLTTTHPESVAGSTYTVTLVNGSSACSSVPTETCLHLAATEYEYAPVIPVDNETELGLREVETGTYRIHSAGGSVADQAPTRSMDLSARVGIGGDVGAPPPIGFGSVLQQKPIPRFTYRPSIPIVDQTLEFDATASTDPNNGTIDSYEWDWDSDGTYEDNGTVVGKMFINPGMKNVTLRVTDNTSASATYNRTLRVGGLAYDDTTGMYNVTGRTDAFTFHLENRHGSPVEIQRVMVDPEDEDLNWIHESEGGGPGDSEEYYQPHEVMVNAGLDGSIEGGVDWASWRDGMNVSDDGGIAHLAQDGDHNLGTVTLQEHGDSPHRASITFTGFEDAGPGSGVDLVGKDVTVGVRYKVNGAYSSVVFTDEIEEAP